MGDVQQLRDWKRGRIPGGVPYALIFEDFERCNALHLIGEFDLSAAKELEDALTRLGAQALPVILDMSACTYIDSTILGVLVRAAKHGGGAISMVVPQEARIRRILSVTRLDEILPLEVTLDQAHGRLGLRHQPAV